MISADEHPFSSLIGTLDFRQVAFDMFSTTPLVDTPS